LRAYMRNEARRNLGSNTEINQKKKKK